MNLEQKRKLADICGWDYTLAGENSYFFPLFEMEPKIVAYNFNPDHNDELALHLFTSSKYAQSVCIRFNKDSGRWELWQFIDMQSRNRISFHISLSELLVNYLLERTE